jgi:putative protein kinase ArgK-like GTPase of G3E family
MTQSTQGCKIFICKIPPKRSRSYRGGAGYPVKTGQVMTAEKKITTHEKVMDIATIVNLEKKDRQKCLKQYRNLKNALDASNLEGEKMGIEKGEKLGIEKGKRSGVINFYKEKAPISVIVKAMELEVARVEGKLRQEGLL